MRNTTPGVITITVIAIIVIVLLAKSNTNTSFIPQPVDAQPSPTIFTQLSTVPVVSPIETPYPKPTYIPTLRPYNIDKSNDIWHAKNPSSYITPNNEWVRYYASQLFIDEDGWIKYKNEKIKWYIEPDGTQHYTYKPFENNYVYDWEQFGNGAKGSLANDDYWINADYYLTHGMKGDCEDFATPVTSMMLSGEMSVWQGDKLVKQIIPAKAVLGYSGNHVAEWVEYQAYGNFWITSTSREQNPQTGEYYSTTIFIQKTPEFRGVFDFTDRYFEVIK
jgi:hypothetical protein